MSYCLFFFSLSRITEKYGCNIALRVKDLDTKICIKITLESKSARRN